MINAKEAYELSMNSISMLCDTAIKEAAWAGKFAVKVSLRDKNFTDHEIYETMKELDALGYHTYPVYYDDRTYIKLDELIIGWGKVNETARYNKTN